MKFVLVDRGDNIVDRVDLQDVGVNGARTYFVGRKQIHRIHRCTFSRKFHSQLKRIFESY